jgi:hypothetical protein
MNAKTEGLDICGNVLRRLRQRAIDQDVPGW